MGYLFAQHEGTNISVRKGKFDVGNTAGQQAVGNKGSSQHLVELTICFAKKKSGHRKIDLGC
jgi:hypothetical protein